MRDFFLRHAGEINVTNTTSEETVSQETNKDLNNDNDYKNQRYLENTN